MAAEVVRDPRAVPLGPRERALAGFASLLTEAPWTVDAGDLGRLSAAGLRDEEVVHAVTISAMFNHFTRVADATGIEFDYASPLPRLAVDASREPVPRPDPGDWPRPPAPRLPLSLRPGTEAAVARWREYAFTGTASLSARERAVAARAAAYGTCDAAGVEAHAAAEPTTSRERALAAYATKLTLTPWRMQEADLAPLRAEGLDDLGILQVAAVTGFQNVASRLRLALGG